MTSQFYKGSGRIVVTSHRAQFKALEFLHRYDEQECLDYLPDNLATITDCKKSLKDVYGLCQVVKDTTLVYFDKFEFDYNKLVCDLEWYGFEALVLVRERSGFEDVSMPTHVYFPNLSFVLT